MKKLILLALLACGVLGADLDTSRYAIHESGRYFINKDTGKMVEEWGRYDRLWCSDNGCFQQAGGLWVFSAELNNKRFWVNVADGKPIWGKYDNTGEITKAGDLQVFLGNQNNKHFWVNTADGNKIWGEYDEIWSIKQVGDLRVFQAKLNDKWFWVNTADGKRYMDKECTILFKE